jgi:hypothetical protein
MTQQVEGSIIVAFLALADGLYEKGVITLPLVL